MYKYYVLKLQTYNVYTSTTQQPLELETQLAAVYCG